jgi:Xaa-Pro dipeptidase
MKTQAQIVRRKIQTIFEKNKLDYMIIFGTGNICYTSGFEPCIPTAISLHILCKDESQDQLVLQFRFDEDEAARTYPREKTTYSYDFAAFITQKIKKNSRIGVVGKDIMTYDIFHAILGITDHPIDVSDAFKAIRFIKTDYEIDMIRKACEITEYAMQESYKKIEPGVTEREVAAYFEYVGNAKGASLAFVSALASGEHSKYVAWLPNHTVIKNNSPIYYDVGLRYKKYCADIGRTLYLGKPSPLFLEKYAQMRDTLETVIDMVKPGLRATDLHKRALELFEKHNLGELRHRIGHGCGIETSTEGIDLMLHDHLILQPNMVICLEVSMNQDDQWGIKIEDVILVTETGYEPLSKSSRELMIIDN